MCLTIKLLSKKHVKYINLINIYTTACLVLRILEAFFVLDNL